MIFSTQEVAKQNDLAELINYPSDIQATLSEKGETGKPKSSVCFFSKKFTTGSLTKLTSRLLANGPRTFIARGHRMVVVGGRGGGDTRHGTSGSQRNAFEKCRRSERRGERFPKKESFDKWGDSPFHTFFLLLRMICDVQPPGTQEESREEMVGWTLVGGLAKKCGSEILKKVGEISGANIFVQSLLST